MNMELAFLRFVYIAGVRYSIASDMMNKEENMQKINLLKEMKHLYIPSAKEASLVDIPAANWLMMDGQGDPNTDQSYKDAIEVLFSVSYAAKFMVKKSALAIDYGVMPLESLWWTDDISTFAVANKKDWNWTAMVLQPSFVSRETLRAAIEQVKMKKKLAALAALRLETFAEGRCAQILHIGPFSEEGPTVARLHQFIADTGNTPCGKHHEIYLSDIRKAAPDNWKTIIRQPIC